MARYKAAVSLICASVFIQSLAASSPSIDLLFPQRTNANNQSTTPSSISQRIHASLNNVLRIPLPLWGTTGGGAQPGGQQQGAPQSLLQLRQQTSGSFGQSDNNRAQAAPPGFLPDVNQAIHTTIAQLSTLSHWPFGYVTTPRSQAQSTQAVAVTTQPTTTRRTTTTVPTTQAPTTTRPPATQAPTTTPAAPLSTTQALPPFPPQISSIFQAPPPTPPPTTARPSLPNRIHNRIHSTLNYIRIPSLSMIGNPRPRPMLTEPPWVTELLGPTLEPPTTRMPTFGERIHNAVNNVLLFVPATLLNFWYQNWGTQHVDRVIQRLQLSTPKPGSPVEPIFATISNQANNPIFANLTGDNNNILGALGNSTGFPAIAAFINANGTLMPTIVHPVVNMTANTIEYQLRSENETTVLWTGSLSNDIFFGNRKFDREGVDDEDEQIKQSALNVQLE